MLALDKPVDKNLDFALWLTARELQGVWLPAFENGEIDFGKNFKQVIFAMKASENAAAVGSLTSAVRDGKVSEADMGDVLRLIADVGGADDFHFLLLHAVGRKDADFLNALAQTSVRRSVVPSGDLGVLKPLLAAEESANVRTAAARAAGAWKQEWAREILAGWLGDAALAPELTHAAIDGMASMGVGESIVKLIDDGARSQLLRTIGVRAFAGEPEVGCGESGCSVGWCGLLDGGCG